MCKINKKYIKTRGVKKRSLLSYSLQYGKTINCRGETIDIKNISNIMYKPQMYVQQILIQHIVS